MYHRVAVAAATMAALIVLPTGQPRAQTGAPCDGGREIGKCTVTPELTDEWLILRSDTKQCSRVSYSVNGMREKPVVVLDGELRLMNVMKRKDGVVVEDCTVIETLRPSGEPDQSRAPGVGDELTKLAETLRGSAPVASSPVLGPNAAREFSRDIRTDKQRIERQQARVGEVLDDTFAQNQANSAAEQAAARDFNASLAAATLLRAGSSRRGASAPIDPRCEQTQAQIASTRDSLATISGQSRGAADLRALGTRALQENQEWYKRNC